MIAGARVRWRGTRFVGTALSQVPDEAGAPFAEYAGWWKVDFDEPLVEDEPKAAYTLIRPDELEPLQ